MYTICPSGVRRLVAQLKRFVQSLSTDLHKTSPEIRAFVCERCWTGPFSKKSFKQFVGGKVVSYPTRWSYVQTAAEGGCGLCGLFIFEKENLKQENSKDKVTFRLTFCRLAAATPGMAEAVTPPGTQFLQIEVEGYEIPVDNIAYYLHTAPNDPAAGQIVARNPIRDVGSPNAYSLALRCIQDCIANHQSCRKPSNTTRLPTRVIDCFDPLHPILFTSKGTNSPYVALSYVWGAEQPHRTMKDNIDQYTTEGINIKIIPKTIHDAIRATKALGLRYLWVDAYCIIQNSREDKDIELTHLRHTFRNAHVTLIASCAPSAFHRFLHGRPTPSPTPTTPCLPFRCADGRLGSVSAQPLYLPYNADAEPANQRAWCLEERLLSPRKLVYASDTLQYHCQTTVRYIGGALAIPRGAERLPNVMFVPDDEMATYMENAGVESRWVQLKWAWADVVANYTRRAVTKPKDKLTALGGVAEQFHRVLTSLHAQTGSLVGSADKGNRYLAGLWERSLVYDLLWLKQDDEPPWPRPSRYIAPSWSWASVDGEVCLTHAYERTVDPMSHSSATGLIFCELLSWEVSLEDERLPHGRVKSGVLTLQSRLVPITWNERNPEIKFKLFVGRDDQAEELLMFHAGVEDERALGPMICVGQVWIDSVELVDGDVWAVPIRWSQEAEDPCTAGLLVTSASNGQYKRFGFWETPELQDESFSQSQTIHRCLDKGSRISTIVLI